MRRVGQDQMAEPQSMTILRARHLRELRQATKLGRSEIRLCCAANVVTASVAREVEGCRDCSNRLLDSLDS